MKKINRLEKGRLQNNVYELEPSYINKKDKTALHKMSLWRCLQISVPVSTIYLPIYLSSIDRNHFKGTGKSTYQIVAVKDGDDGGNGYQIQGDFSLIHSNSDF